LKIIIAPLMAYKTYNVSETTVRKYARYLVEARIGRRLRKDEIVHHMDGDAYNIEPANLVVTDRYTHQIWHKGTKKHRAPTTSPRGRETRADRLTR
jgi:hypothetical protein